MFPAAMQPRSRHAPLVSVVLLVLGLAGAVAAAPPYKCATAADCELLGECNAGACVCRAGFKGPSCGSLDVEPLQASNAYGALWPPTLGAPSARNTTFSWGFTVVYDEAAKLYHAAVNVGCCGLHGEIKFPTGGSCGVTVGGTLLAHVTSKYPDRGFVQAGVFTSPTAFNPHLIRAKNGTYILYFRCVSRFDCSPLLLPLTATAPQSQRSRQYEGKH